MSDTRELEARLRERAGQYDAHDWHRAIELEAADALAAMREKVVLYRGGLSYFVARAFADGFFEDDSEVTERVRLWVLATAEEIDDELSIGEVVMAILADHAAAPKE